MMTRELTPEETAVLVQVTKIVRDKLEKTFLVVEHLPDNGRLEGHRFVGAMVDGVAISITISVTE